MSPCGIHIVKILLEELSRPRPRSSIHEQVVDIMHYSLFTRLAQGFAAITLRLERYPRLRTLWWGVTKVLVALCLLGLFAAIPYCLITPFLAVAGAGLTPSAPKYELVVGLCLTVVVGWCFLLGSLIYRRFRVRLIDMDLITILLGSVLAVWYLARVFLGHDSFR